MRVLSASRAAGGPSRMRTIAGLLPAAVAILVPLSASAALPPPLTLTRVATGLSQPLYVTAAPGDTSRLFIVEKAGRIKVMQNGTVLGTPFLDMTSIVKSNGWEQGLLGLAFDPNYQTNKKFYVNYIDLLGNTNNSSYTVSANPNIANTTRTPVLSYVQPSANHNGGWIGFGPDGHLYISSGDGGGGNDPNNYAQSLNTFLGKMLRINPNGADAFPADPDRNYAIPASNPFVGVAGEDEIWSYGLRNPWRASFDRATGALYIGDVGQDAWEEIDYQPAASAGGQNYGWRVYEGNHATGLGGLNPPGSPVVFPIHEYVNDGVDRSVTGGYVYRGSTIENLPGTYLFGDYASQRIWSFRYDGVSKTEFRELTSELLPNIGSLDSIASFGEDASGELYVVDLDGDVFKIGSRIFGDATADGKVNGADYTVWADHYLETGVGFDLGDFNRDGTVDGGDYTLWADRFQSVSAMASAVPEPSSLALMATALCGLLAWNRHRRRANG